MSTLSSLSREASRLWAGLQEEVILPGQPRFNEARQAFNPAADQEPAAVVFAESAHDMVAAVTFTPARAGRSPRRTAVTTLCGSGR